ncbi:MAG: Hsp20/alpha crystallin family protein, partial [bacterium]|nr:Hsp20/alpha crystallin family protein [bacterium]
MAKVNYSFLEVEIAKNFSSGISTHVDWVPRSNVVETEEYLIVEIELPGVNKNDISIQLQGSKELVIRGSKPQPKPGKEQQVTYHLFEREFGSFYKKINIEFPIDSTDINSVMSNGVLTITLKRL